MKLTEQDLQRYSRQILIDGFGKEGQLKLKNSTVGMLGCGGLGTATSIYLAAAGVGRLILADSDKPDITNLNRQITHYEYDIKNKRNKADSTKEKLSEFNSDIEIETYTKNVNEENIEKVFEKADLIVDCLDNFEDRYMLNSYCVRTNKPLIHAAVYGFYGQLTIIVPEKTACLKCIFPSPPPQIKIFPIIGVTAGLFGILEANEVIKYITGVGKSLFNKMMLIDLSENEVNMIKTERDKKCPICS